MLTAARTAVRKGLPLYHSQLAGVSDAAWTALVQVLMVPLIGEKWKDGTPLQGEVRPLDFEGSTGDLGCFALRQKHLVDLKLMRVVKDDNGRFVRNAFVRGDVDRFKANSLAQYDALSCLLRRYDSMLPRPDGMSRSGAVALCHRAGPTGLVSWARRKLPATVVLVGLADGLF